VDYTPIHWDRRTLVLLLVQWALFAGNFVLYATRPLPILCHVLIGVVAIHLSFTIWHEAAHGNVSNRHWLNDAVGILGMFPYGTPFFLQRHVHLAHHRRLNEAEDPNRVYTEGPLWALPLRYPGALARVRRLLADDPRSSWMRASDAASLALLVAIGTVAALRGALSDLVLLWILPLVIAKLIMDWYVNYLPHVGLPADRFGGTRILDVKWLTPLVLAHNYHAIHHLWPAFPWHRYPACYRERREYLVAHHVPIETRFVFDPQSPPSRRSDRSLPREE
jgi:fatty acid desaturase